MPGSSLAFFSDFIGRKILRARELGWQPCKGSSTSTAGAYGRRRKSTKAQRSTSPWGLPSPRARIIQNEGKRHDMPEDGIEILLVEDNPKDLKLTMKALTKRNLANRIEVAQDGEEALDYLFCRGQYATRNFGHPPRLVLLDLKLPKMDGIEVLRQVKADAKTRAIPVVILTSSREE